MTEKIHNYAPILICTLNRYEHLRKTINALRANLEAIYTDLYISVDYTDEEKYLIGYNKVKEYLSNGIEGFKTCTIFYQNTNLGPFDHFITVRNQLRKRYGYNTIITLEDDLVASPNFLKYMNMCFEYYRDDPDVYGISEGADFDTSIIANKGYSTFLFWYGAEIGLFLNKSPYEYNVDGNLNSWINCYEIVRNFRKLFKDGFCILIALALKLDKTLLRKDGSTAPIDYYKVLYKFINNKYCVLPTVCKMEDIGHDGSGLHCKYVENGDSRILDDSNSFEFMQSDKNTSNSLLSNLFHNTSKFTKKEYYKYLILYYVYKIFGREVAQKTYFCWESFKGRNGV